MKMRRPLFILLCFATALCLCACSAELPPFSDSYVSESSTDSPYDGEIRFEGRRYSYAGSSDCIEAEGDLLIIKKSGDYLISGELIDGRIAIDCDGCVTLYLGGVSMRSSMGAVIEHRGGGELTVATLSGSLNYLSASQHDGGDILPSAAIRAFGDARFTGDGSLTVTSGNCGVSVGGNIYVNGGSLTLKADDFGLWARDGIWLSNGTLTVTYARVGLFVYGGEHSPGELEISGGTLVALCEDTALSASRRINITGGIGDLRAKVLYRCERVVNGKVEAGQINVTSAGFPKN